MAAFLSARGLPHRRLDEAALLDEVSALLEAGRVVGWFQGRMEFGPRALGNRPSWGTPARPRCSAR
ncbi:MAG: hypothetical protein IPO09_15335 [Anaeromyxobacter sp.]|nr:hypothetical protein [Anaeromyxobacter sp.]